MLFRKYVSVKISRSILRNFKTTYTSYYIALPHMESIPSKQVQLHLGMTCKTNRKTHLYGFFTKLNYF